MKNNVVKLGLILAVSLLLIGVAACSGAPATANLEKITVTRGNITHDVSADGSLSLPQDKDRKLSFGTSSKIDQINVKEGDRVAAGAVLAKLDTADMERAVKTAELALTSANIDRQQADLGVKSATFDLEQASDNYRKITYPYTYSTFVFDVPTALDHIGNAERQVGDIQSWVQGGQNTNQLSDITKELRDALDNLTSARESLARGTGQDVFQGGVLPVKDFWTLRAAQLQMDKAQVALDNAQNIANKTRLASDKAQYDLDTAKNILSRAIITAPLDGIVSTVAAKAGDILSAVDYNKTIIEVVDSRYMELTIDVEETDIPGVKLGQEATINIDAVPGTKLTGKVTFVSPVSHTLSGVVFYRVKAGFDVPESLGLKEGMSTTADIVTARQNGVLLLPTRAINRNTSTVNVLVNGQASPRKIVTGISDGYNTEIISGLNEGDIVVVPNQWRLSSSE